MVKGYKASADRIEVSASGFGGGLFLGASVVGTGRYVENQSGSATAAATGQFIYNTTSNSLWWDVDGTGQAAAMLIANLTGAKGWAGTEIAVIA